MPLRSKPVLSTQFSPPTVWSRDKEHLVSQGKALCFAFCKLNNIPAPVINVIKKEDWHVGACAYYRPDTPAMRKWTTPGINICLDLCGRPCTENEVRNWTWPGSVTDREPYGVIAHELGHHCDWLTGEKKWEYGSEYCEQVMKESEEAGITSYAAENPAEWFAESFRLFLTNPDLLRMVRPLTYDILLARWRPVIVGKWLGVLGDNVPSKIVKTLLKKGAK